MSHDLSPSTPWRRSRFCVGEAHCVEVSEINNTLIGMRDSKTPTTNLAFPKAAWRDFVDTIKAGRLQP